MKTFTVAFGVFMLSCCVFTSQAQEVAKADKPKTKLEAFQAQDGQVIIKGFSTVGELRGLYGASLSIDVKEFLQPTSGQKAYGMTVEIKESGRIEREHTSYIDYDEIESVIKGLDYISKIEKSAVKLDEFQADYRTRGDFSLSTFSAQGKTMLSIKSGTIGSTTAFYNQEDIQKIRALFETARVKLDSIKK